MFICKVFFCFFCRLTLLSSQAHRPVQKIVIVEALPLLPLAEIDLFSSDTKVAAFVAACDLRKDAALLPDIARRSSKVCLIRK